MMEEVLPQGWTARMMKISRGALAEGEGGVAAEGEEEEEYIVLVASHPSDACQRPSPPNKWILSVSAENWEV